jgi:hypothetical protein
MKVADTISSRLVSESPQDTSKLGRFIQTYSSFLSSFVIGVAGLIATSVWQYRQSETAAAQARSEQAIARTKAENDWRITRAEILSKNLNVLSTQGPQTADQRFGVLLSLTRGSIIDPELAVSYALELGKDNASYMRSVLESTVNKNYEQLAQGFKLTCLQRFGVEKAAEICKDDALADRSDAIAQVVEDELNATAAVAAESQAAAVGAPAPGAAAPAPTAGPLGLLRDERLVQDAPSRLSWIFEPYLQDLYERRQWKEIQRFETASTGAKLVAALVLATARTGELLSPTEAVALERFHAERRKWLAGYLMGATCDSECRGKLVDAMLSSFGEAQGDYDEPLQHLLRQSRAEAGATLGHLHARLLWCQIDGNDLAELRDRVLVPTFLQVVADAHADATMVEDLAGLVALVPEPGPRGDAKDGAGWKAMLAALAKGNEKAQRTFALRRTSAARERATPPPMIKKVNFCNAQAASPFPRLDP